MTTAETDQERHPASTLKYSSDFTPPEAHVRDPSGQLFLPADS